MPRIILKHSAQLLLVLTPVITLNWSILNWLGFQGSPTDHIEADFSLFTLSGPKQVVELKIRVLVVALGAAILLFHDSYEHYRPRRDNKKFKAAYLESLKKQWEKILIPDIRINILHAKRYWFFPFLSFFSWTWNYNFSLYDKDTNLFLSTRQGVAGIAFRKGRPQLVDLRKAKNFRLHFHEKFLLLNQFHLWHSQLKKTESLQCILSIPLLMATTDLSPEWRVVGVINLDTSTEIGAEFLNCYDEVLANYFIDYGKVIAYLC